MLDRHNLHSDCRPTDKQRFSWVEALSDLNVLSQCIFSPQTAVPPALQQSSPHQMARNPAPSCNALNELLLPAPKMYHGMWTGVDQLWSVKNSLLTPRLAGVEIQGRTIGFGGFIPLSTTDILKLSDPISCCESFDECHQGVRVGSRKSQQLNTWTKTNNFNALMPLTW